MEEIKKIGIIFIGIAISIFMITMSNGPGTTNPEEDIQIATILLLTATIFFVIGLLLIMLYNFYLIIKKIFLPFILSFPE